MEFAPIGFCDLPAEIRDMIISYLDAQVFIEISDVSPIFQESVERLISRGHKLCFTEQFKFRGEGLNRFITRNDTVKRKLRHIDLNCCFWVSPYCYGAIGQLENLQHLHVIDCKISPQFMNLVLNMKLTSLSFSWTLKWLKKMESKRAELLEPSSENYPRLFLHLKHLVLHINYRFIAPRATRDKFIDHICDNFLRHCKELEGFKMYDTAGEDGDDSIEQAVEYRERPFEQLPADPFLPKLKTLFLDLERNYSIVTEFILMIIKGKQNLLEQIYLGQASLPLLENDKDMASLIISSISASQISTICLECYFNGCDHKIVNREMPIWKDGPTPNCHTVLLSNTRITSRSQFFDLLTANCPKLRYLHIKRCKLSARNLFYGLTTIVKICPLLTALILTVDLLGGSLNFNFLGIIGEFKALKVLHLTDEIILAGEVIKDIDIRPINRMLPEEVEDAMKSLAMYRLTQNCRFIEEFRIWAAKTYRFMLLAEVSDLMLACCSYWPDLKYLYLEDYITKAEYGFLPFITYACKRLTTFTMGEPRQFYIGNLFAKAFIYAESLRDLRVFGWFHLTDEMCVCLGECVNLEKIYAHFISIHITSISYFEELLAKLPNLISVIFACSSPRNSKRMEVEVEILLRRLMTSRPAFFYKWRRRTNNNISNYPVMYQQPRHSSYYR